MTTPDHDQQHVTLPNSAIPNLFHTLFRTFRDFNSSCPLFYPYLTSSYMTVPGATTPHATAPHITLFSWVLLDLNHLYSHLILTLPRTILRYVTKRDQTIQYQTIQYQTRQYQTRQYITRQYLTRQYLTVLGYSETLTLCIHTSSNCTLPDLTVFHLTSLYLIM